MIVHKAAALASLKSVRSHLASFATHRVSGWFVLFVAGSDLAGYLLRVHLRYCPFDLNQLIDLPTKFTTKNDVTEKPVHASAYRI